MQIECPECNADDSIDMSGHQRLCLACRCEWDETKTFAAPEVVDSASELVAPTNTELDRILDATTASEVLTVPDVGESPPTTAPTIVGPVSALLNNWAGQWVQIPRGGVVLCVEDDGGEIVTVTLEDGEECPLQRAFCKVVDYDPMALAPTVGAETVSEDQPYDPAIFATASLALTIGLAAVGDDEARTLYNPRIGWLPPPCNEVPEVEQGIAYAIAVLVSTFGLPREDVERIAATLMLASQSTNESDQQ
jgi:hypothetical protein